MRVGAWSREGCIENGLAGQASPFRFDLHPRGCYVTTALRDLRIPVGCVGRRDGRRRGARRETKEHIGGYQILDAANMDAARSVGTQGRRRLPRIGRGARVPRNPNRIETNPRTRRLK